MQDIYSSYLQRCSGTGQRRNQQQQLIWEINVNYLFPQYVLPWNNFFTGIKSNAKPY